MPDMFIEFDAVAFDLPGTPALRGKIVLIGILALLKTASERPRFLVGGFCCVLCRSQSGHTGKHEQSDNRRHAKANKSPELLSRPRTCGNPNRSQIVPQAKG
jgi:hypothetical protein